MNQFSSYPNFEKFKHKNILGIDYGTKKVGLATFCPGREPFPVPYTILKFKSDASLIDELKKIIKDESIDVVVLGLPLYLDGNESQMTKIVRQFFELLTNQLAPISTFLQDETLTSFEAESRMKESPQHDFKIDKNKLDSISAAIILEDFIRG